MARNDPQLNLRLPSDLKQKLEEAAANNNRTLTAETVDRLISSFSTGSNPENLLFLMARMEMRTAEAELDLIRLKLMLTEVTDSLEGAVKLLSSEPFNSLNPHIIDSWKFSIQWAHRHLRDTGEFSGTMKELEAAERKKVDEYAVAIEKVGKILDETAHEKKKL